MTWLHIDQRGQVVRSSPVPMTPVSREGLYAVKTDGMWHYRDAHGEAWADRYEAAPVHVGGYAVVDVDGKSGLIDANGNYAIPCRFDRLHRPSEGRCSVLVDGKAGVVSLNGEFVLEPRFLHVGRYACGLCRVSIGVEQWRFVDRTGAFVGGEYEWAEHFGEGAAAVYRDGEWMFVDCRGEKTIDCSRFSNVGTFREGLARARVEGGLTGYIDTAGELVIEAGFDSTFGFREGLAEVEVGGRIGYIDRTGHYVVEPRYSIGEWFSEGLAMVVRDGLCGYIDKFGRERIPPRYEVAGPFESGLAMAIVDEQ